MGESSGHSSKNPFLSVGENIVQTDSSGNMGKSSDSGCSSQILSQGETLHLHQQNVFKSVFPEDMPGSDQKLRFTKAQTRHLEATYATQPRPDGQEKYRLAMELGVQPRQVEVWFQNRRARGRAKCIQQQRPKCESEAFMQRCQDLLVHNHQLHYLIQIM